jgi:hypothetical protein
MKILRSVLTIGCVCILSVAVQAQEMCVDKTVHTPKKVAVKDHAVLDVNNIDCYVINDGSVGENPATGGDGFFFPSGQQEKSIIYTAGIWVIGGVNGQIRSAVHCYGSEFQPGSILADGNPDNSLDPKYRVYKYYRGDVIDAEAIAQGCPDEVVGDQMLFYVMNDIKSHDGMWGGVPLGIEVQVTTFGYYQAGALGNTVFIRYRMINKGSDPIDSAYVAMFFDPDVGQANDDYAGTDTSLGAIFVYNGDGYDEKYGTDVPAMACDFFQGPIVPAPGETAKLPDGTEIADHKILPMTASFFYI